MERKLSLEMTEGQIFYLLPDDFKTDYKVTYNNSTPLTDEINLYMQVPDWIAVRSGVELRLSYPIDGWQPIETAPKDGTEILAWRKDAGCFIARYTCCSEFMTTAEIEESGLDDETLFAEDWFCADFIAGVRLDGDLVPTHWKPLKNPVL